MSIKQKLFLIECVKIGNDTEILQLKYVSGSPGI